MEPAFFLKTSFQLLFRPISGIFLMLSDQLSHHRRQTPAKDRRHARELASGEMNVVWVPTVAKPTKLADGLAPAEVPFDQFAIRYGHR